MKQYRIIYTFSHRTMGWQNSITIDAFSLDIAMAEAKEGCLDLYGSDIVKRMSFKPDPLHNGVVIR